jgi:hypothetical protein
MIWGASLEKSDFSRQFKGPADRVSAAKIFPHTAFSRTDTSLTSEPLMKVIKSPSVHQYLVLFLACVAGLPEIVM